ncbi:DUF3967 domain-containing protein [Bacillus nitratireducens]|uniref:DUF3967 domain-containing protein n=1 Tax=Bacillus nitratireducens TaxID=2026193 RepID=UPI000BF72A1C|nr:DUF3967 domain-containing protein [Bacillus nitratireducens]MED0906785.1 DUF3967 domain-containing protein [Bacillus nitratireducens]PFH90754.1 hypothetical protein COI81_08850 [Bacillus cereus]PFM52811.1 hypothetical protein COJ52_25435 [Bacillus cereus]
MSDGTRNGIRSEPLPAFLTKEVAETLSISESYLRKWCLELEKHEYTFIKVRDPKSNREYRTFTSKDIKALKQFQTLMKDAGYNKVDAAKTVAINFKNENWNTSGTSHDPMDSPPLLITRDKEILERENNTNLLRELLHEEREEREEITKELQSMREELRRTQEEFQTLKDDIKIYQKYHEQLLQKRDEQLLHNIQSIQETKQLVASTIENKQHWWKFWK